MKVVQLLSVLLKSPAEFRDRTLVIVNSRLSLLSTRQPTYDVSEWESVAAQLGNLLGEEFEAALSDTELTDVESSMWRRMETLPPGAPFGTFHNGGSLLARLCYAVVRALRPECVLETGVCYGVTSAFILAGLEQNIKGTLHSVDLPPLGNEGDRFVGWAIQEELSKTRWRLHRGVSGKILPKLLKEIENLDLFVHDSLHTYRNMRMEFELVWPLLRPGGVLISDDIQWNSAFQEFTRRPDVTFHAAVREIEKDSLLGVLLKST